MTDFVSGYGSIVAGNSAKAIARHNAKLSEAQAKASEYESKYEADRIERQGTRALGQLTVDMTASGLGTSRAVLRDQAFEAARERTYTLWQGQVSKQLGMAYASGQRYEGSVAQFSSYLSAAGSFAKGAYRIGTAVANAGVGGTDTSYTGLPGTPAHGAYGARS